MENKTSFDLNYLIDYANAIENQKYLTSIIKKYIPPFPKFLLELSPELIQLKTVLRNWANVYLLDILDSGSHAKGTAINFSSDIDYIVSLKSEFHEQNGGLKTIYTSLKNELIRNYGNESIRFQNVSFRINIFNLKIDITPARKHKGNTNNHSLFVSKRKTWTQTNIQKHINDVSKSGRTQEIKLLKIWRELHKLDFPSIYLEYLIINILSGKSLENNCIEKHFILILEELAKGKQGDMNRRMMDPANSKNILSELLTNSAKDKIIRKAKESLQFFNKSKNWKQVIWI